MNLNNKLIARKLLFISNEATRTGAPISLLSFLKWLRKNTDIQFDVILRNGGELLNEYKKIAPTTNLNQSNLLKQFLDYFDFPAYDVLLIVTLRMILNRRKYALIYSNTITNGKILKHLSLYNIPVITHVREMKKFIELKYGVDNFLKFKNFSNYYIGVSNAVKQNLIEFGVAEECIDVVYNFIDERYISREETIIKRNKTRQELNIPENAFVVVSCGTIEMNKGIDLIVPLFRLLSNRVNYDHIYFIWVGGKISKIVYQRLISEIRNNGLQDRILFLGIREDPIDVFISSDLFVLLSREDSFPRVILEASSVGKPILCFDNAGGATEFVDSEIGRVVPFLDVHSMALEIISLIKNPDLYRELSRKSIEKSKLYTIDVQAPKLLSIIERYI
jgi:glycosyltransferase involved in cell wall biosynthesis